ncbi:ABC transporter substrate-binding protein [Ktedonosporobacter rubrisoli]|uniref:ABC transporter substrate-binding protein n=1 Tax=Ktedonosporobacter rubrisoli TaxID=2509675 RepID=A0A4P6JTW2_KTERU|nr:ABC transporter substrate-binding protein [Ktedonosporobacter rubrisoli]QBD78894.1 ABC transporter substrate-binding protein [Ktedonosporobacter rubrisoli]
MRSRWPGVAYLMILAAMLLMTACGGTSGSSSSNGNTSTSSNPGVLDPNKKYTVDFWEAFGIGANKTVIEDLTKQYMQAHPNVTVKLQAFDSYDTLQTKLTAAIAANKPPTMAQIYENWATQFQQSNALASLQPFISGKNGLSQQDLADFYPVLLKDGQIGGTQYMLPFNKSDLVLYYNADMLQKAGVQPPKTLQEFALDLTKLTKPDGSQWGLSYTPDVDGWSVLYKALGGGDFTSADGKSAAFADGQNKQYATQALGLLAPLAKAGAVHVTKSYNWQNDFISQKAAFGISTIATYAFLAKPIGNTFKFNEVPLPAGPAGQFTVLFGTNLAIFANANTDAQTAAWDYMKFLTNTQSNATFVKGTGYMPIRQSTFNSSDLQSYYEQVPARKVGPQSMGSAFVASAALGWSQCRNIITTNFTSAITGQLTPDAAMSKMAQSCNSALSQA